MKIDYVVISSDENPLYKDFYPIVAKRWFDLGFKTYYINICDMDSIESNEWGIVHKMKSLDFVPTGFQSQVVRLYCSNFIDGVLLMSDIDMLPIKGDYFRDGASELTDDNIVIYSGQPYGNVPYYPMCYVASKSKNLREYLEFGGKSFSDYCFELSSKYGQAWNTDENFMYDKLQNHLSKLIIKNDRDFSRRIDRGNWQYDVELLSAGYYIDSHLLRPYSMYKEHIDFLIQIIEN